MLIGQQLAALGGLLEQTEVPDYPQVFLRKDGWILAEPALVRLFHRLMNEGTPLGELVKGQMYAGIKTGLNEAFVIDQAKRDELIGEDPRSEELIKPWLRGRDIRRWRAEWAGRYLIAIQNSGDATASNPWAEAKSEEEAGRIFRENYPAIHEHLSWWKEYPDPKRPDRKIGLRHRTDQGRFWWELRACDFYPEFAPPKVVWKKTSFRPAFIFDLTGNYLSNTLHFVARTEPWLAAVMNSTIMEFLMVLRINLLRGGYIELTPTRIDSFPVPHISAKQLVELNQLAEQVAGGRFGAEGQIDEVLSQHFSLAPRELDLIRRYLAVRWEFGPDDESEDTNDD